MKLRYLLPRVDVGALRASFREFGQDLREHRPRMMFSALSALGVSLMTLATPWPIKLALDYALFPGQSSVGYDMFAWLRDWDASAIVFFSAGSVLLVAALKGLLAFGQEVQAKAVGHQLVAQIRLRLDATLADQLGP
ncbi:MAG: hypothetical protein ACE5GA_01595, partial [Candidatus Zixiibacteriota bacterium]